MNWIVRTKKRGVSGFSLLELMVVVAILGVLAMVAVPRYNIFRARSRQAEAKTNLGVIFTLQESFRIEKEVFFDGNSEATPIFGTLMRLNPMLTPRSSYPRSPVVTSSPKSYAVS